MRTVKQVSELTGISVRALHYYDEIGLLKPSKITEAGYRLYDEEALETLQQILFFKELGLALKEVKEILSNPCFDRMQALKDHKKLIILKRDHLNDLIELINNTLEGAKTVSFKEFDMSEYFNALDEFKKDHTEEVMKYWGSIDKFNDFVESTKAKEAEVAAMAIKQYGSIEKYTQAMKRNLDNYTATMEQLNSIKDNLDDYKTKSDEMHQKLTSDLSKDTTSDEIQNIVADLVTLVNGNFKNIDMGENYWGLLTEAYLTSPEIIEVTDKLYGSGSSKFIGEALKFYFEKG